MLAFYTVLTLAGGFGIFVFFCRLSTEGFGDSVLMGFFGAVFAVLVGVLSIFFVVIFIPTELVPYSTEIVSLKNDSSISGSFFLGCGSIGETESYLFFVKTGDSSFIRKTSPTQYTTIIERDDITPRFQWALTVYKGSFNKWFGKFPGTTNPPTNLTLIVPTGTIIKRMEIY